MQQATEVGGGRNVVSGPDLLRGAGASQNVASLHHQNFATGAGKVAGAGETVVPRAHDDCVILVHSGIIPQSRVIPSGSFVGGTRAVKDEPVEKNANLQE